MRYCWGEENRTGRANRRRLRSKALQWNDRLPAVPPAGAPSNLTSRHKKPGASTRTPRGIVPEITDMRPYSAFGRANRGFLPSGLYRQRRNCTGSVPRAGTRGLSPPVGNCVTLTPPRKPSSMYRMTEGRVKQNSRRIARERAEIVISVFRIRAYGSRYAYGSPGPYPQVPDGTDRTETASFAARWSFRVKPKNPIVDP